MGYVAMGPCERRSAMTVESSLDMIAQGSSGPTAAVEAARSLSPDEVRKTAVVHVAGLLRVIPTAAKGQPARFGNLLVEISPAQGQGDIVYDDVGASFSVKGVTLSAKDGPHTLGDLLELMQYARDRSDTLMLLPPDMRQERIRGLAETLGAGEAFVRFILAHYPAIERGLEV
jgi:hypothetical protein